MSVSRRRRAGPGGLVMSTPRTLLERSVPPSPSAPPKTQLLKALPLLQRKAKSSSVAREVQLSASESAAWGRGFGGVRFRTGVILRSGGGRGARTHADTRRSAARHRVHGRGESAPRRGPRPDGPPCKRGRAGARVHRPAAAGGAGRHGGLPALNPGGPVRRLELQARARTHGHAARRGHAAGRPAPAGARASRGGWEVAGLRS